MAFQNGAWHARHAWCYCHVSRRRRCGTNILTTPTIYFVVSSRPEYAQAAHKHTEQPTTQLESVSFVDTVIKTRITLWILPGPLLSWQPTWKGRFHQQVCRATWKFFLLQIFLRDENKVLWIMSTPNPRLSSYAVFLTCSDRLHNNKIFLCNKNPK